MVQFLEAVMTFVSLIIQIKTHILLQISVVLIQIVFILMDPYRRKLNLQEPKTSELNKYKSGK